MQTILILVLAIAALVVLAERVHANKWPFDQVDKAAEHMQDGSDTITRQMANFVLDGLTDKLQGLAEYDDLTTKKARLESEITAMGEVIASLERDKAEIESDFKRQRLDMEHEVGLMKKQLEHELKTGQETADLGAEKKIVAAEKKFNDTALKDAREAMEARFESQDKMVDRLAALVPNIEAAFVSKVVRKEG